MDLKSRLQAAIGEMIGSGSRWNTQAESVAAAIDRIDELESHLATCQKERYRCISALLDLQSHYGGQLINNGTSTMGSFVAAVLSECPGDIRCGD